MLLKKKRKYVNIVKKFVWKGKKSKLSQRNKDKIDTNWNCSNHLREQVWNLKDKQTKVITESKSYVIRRKIVDKLHFSMLLRYF